MELTDTAGILLTDVTLPPGMEPNVRVATGATVPTLLRTIDD